MPNMKTLGAILIVLGLLMTIIGYGLYGNVMCHCTSQTVANPFGCHCGTVLQQSIGHLMVYSGLVVAGSGMLVFTHWWRKKIIFN